MAKVFSTPADPSQGIAGSIAQACQSQAVAKSQSVARSQDVAKQESAEKPRGATLLLHGTTVGTNAILQRRGGRVAFVTTAGFEDSIEIGRQARPKLYDFFFDAVKPLAPQELRFGVKERCDKDGNVLLPLAAKELRWLRRKIAAARPRADAVAVSLLFSFANPVHEQAIEGALAGLKLPISASHRILPEFREYERASTVVMNAYLQTVMETYLRRLGERVRGRILVMQSSGGLTSLETAAREPVRTVLSGPAGGVVGAAAMARQSGIRRIISFDMGGTSTDVCLVDGAPVTTNEAEVAGLPVRVPMLNIHTVGAGGGSLARFDAGGALRVGPESAGADPGPICYGRGVEPTVTDANLLLGRLPAGRFLGGALRLDAERTKRRMQAWLRGRKQDLSLTAFAEGVVRVANATMEKAIRLVSIEKGHDPREFTLVAFGGAGGLHACELAQALEVPRVLVPRMPGALSAIGILLSDTVKDYSRSLLIPCRQKLPLPRITEELRRLRAGALADFKREGWKGQPRFAARLDLRYVGQGFEIAVPFSSDALEAFHREHTRLYGHSSRTRDVELVTLRLRAWLPAPKVNLRPEKIRRGKAEWTQTIFGGKRTRTAVVERETVSARGVMGPAILTEYGATTLVPPGWRARRDPAGNLLMTNI